MNYFDYEYRVMYRDTDKMGISYYSNYLVWFEAARTEYFRSLGLPYTECEKRGYFLPVVEATVRYFRPSTYDDLLIVRTSVSAIRQSSMRFEYQIFKKGKTEILSSGVTIHAFVDARLRPVRVPAEIRDLVTLHRLLKNKN